MTTNQLNIFVSAALFLGLYLPNTVRASDSSDEDSRVEVIEIQGEKLDSARDFYFEDEASSATGLKLKLKETPQAITIITRNQIDDFALQNVNEVLEAAAGVSVEKVETDRTYYSARGFDITNFEVDGVGIPFVYGNTAGDMDIAIYDRVEIVRGANGLMSFTGHPSATVNFIRKRPTTDWQASIATSVGSWSQQRIEADVSASLTESGAVRGRAVAAYQNGDSYLNRYELEKAIVYGVVEVDLGQSGLLTLGHAQQENKPNSPLWGALTLNNTDGTQVDYHVSRSTATDWSYWDGVKRRSFAELGYDLGGDWYLTATFNQRKDETDGALFYAYALGGLNPDSSGLYAYSSLYQYSNEQLLADIAINGTFELAGRSHQLSFGVHWSESTVDDLSTYGQDIGTPLPPFNDWDGDYPMPSFGPAQNGSHFEDRIDSYYLATRLRLTEQLSFIGGVRSTSIDSKGSSYGSPKEYSISHQLVPYAGLVYDLSDNWALYASQSEIFNPQREMDVNGNRLDPVEGVNRELGLKAVLFDGLLNAAVAVFESEQNNVAEYAGTDTTTGRDYFIGVDGVTSSGYEFDVMGRITKGLQLSGGFTNLKIEGADGQSVRPYTPRTIFRLSGTYRFQSLADLKVGLSYRWQDAIYREQGLATTGPNAGEPFTVKQDSYGLLSAMAQYDVSDSLMLRLNVDNLTNEKYLTSLYWAQSYYGAPRNYSLTLRWGF